MRLTPDRLAEGTRRGERAAVARAISVVEEGGPAACELLGLLGVDGRPSVVGVTGPPGAGKSTLVDCLVRGLRSGGGPVAVLAFDPSSPVTGGAVLGDRVRMDAAAADPGVYVRSLSSRGALGGVSPACEGAVRVLGAAGFPLVVVETVGVGQSEVDVASSSDVVVLVLTPGAGDVVQSLKAGVLEIADVIVINKADRPGAALLEKELKEAGGAAEILRTTATTCAGVDALSGTVRSLLARRPRAAGSGRRFTPAPVRRGDVDAVIEECLREREARGPRGTGKTPE